MILAALLLLQDAAPLPPILDSHYRLERDGRHVGYVSESYVPGKSWRRTMLDGDVFRSEQVAILPGGFAWSPSDGAATVERESDDELPPVLALFRLRQEGALAAPGRLRLRVLDAAGVLRELPLDVGPLMEVEAFGRRPRMTTIAFPEGCPGLDLATARVDRFGRLYDGRFRDGLRLRLVKDEAEAMGSLPRPPGRRTLCWSNRFGRRNENR